jgi:haloacetate dehalogenase
VAEPTAFLRTMLARWSGGGLDVFSPDALAEYVRCFSDPATIHGSCEDYRAGATIDFADYGRRRITCPLLVLWAGRGRASRRGSPIDVWRECADDVRGQALKCGHFLPEERPEEIGAALGNFFRVA